MTCGYELWDSWALLSTEGVQWDVVWRREWGFLSLWQSRTVEDRWQASLHFANAWFFCKLGLWQCPSLSGEWLLQRRPTVCFCFWALVVFVLHLCISRLDKWLVPLVWLGYVRPSNCSTTGCVIVSRSGEMGPVSSQQVVLPTALATSLFVFKLLSTVNLNSIVLCVKLHIRSDWSQGFFHDLQSLESSSGVMGMFLSTQWFHRRTSEMLTQLSLHLSPSEFPFCWYHFLFEWFYFGLELFLVILLL